MVLVEVQLVYTALEVNNRAEKNYHVKVNTQ